MKSAIRRIIFLLLACVASTAAWAQVGPNCLYYAVNSSAAGACFQNKEDAVAFIRTPDANGDHPLRANLVETGNSLGNNHDAPYLEYGVRPIPGTEGAQVYEAKNYDSINSYTLVACESSGTSAQYIPFGPMNGDCSTNSALCTYHYYCKSQSSIIQAISTYLNANAGQCRTGISVSLSGAIPGQPIGGVVGAPDAGQPLPPNSVGFAYWLENSAQGFVGQSYQMQWQGNDANHCGGPGGGLLESIVATPVTCPAGWINSPQGSPPRTSDACTSNEYGYIQTYKGPTDGKQPCPDGHCGRYGNPVLAATGAKLQTPFGWNSGAMLGLELTYNSATDDDRYDLFGRSWNSLLSSRYDWHDYYSDNLSFTDAEGNIDIYTRSTNGIWRATNSSGRYMRVTSTAPCEFTVFDGDRRFVYGCDKNVYTAVEHSLKRIEYPANPRMNLTVVWSTSEAFDAQGNQTIFPEVPLGVVRGDGRHLDFIYTRINTGAQCNASQPWTCNLVRMTAIGDNEGNLTLFDYNAAGRLTLISYPDGTRERFEYGAAADICPASMPGACTGSVNPELAGRLLTGTYQETPSGNGYVSVRYGTYQYDNQGRTIVTTHAGDAGRTEFRYEADDTPTVRTYEDATHYTNRRIVSQRVYIYAKPSLVTESDPSGTILRSASSTYDPTLGYLSQSTDFLGVRTDWTYNDAGLLTQKIESANVPATKRTIQTTWDTTQRVPTDRYLYDSSTSSPGTLKARWHWTYNARGQALTALIVDANNAANNRTTSFIYCEQTDVDAGTCPLVGLVTMVNGPRVGVSDNTWFTYYASDDPSCASAPTTCPHRKGDLWKVKNAALQETLYLNYDGAGRPLKVQDPNGVISQFVYSTRGWLTQVIVHGVVDSNSIGADDAVTTIAYDPSGLVSKITEPDGDYLSYTYDAARRLTDVTDNLGRSIHYTLDIAGHRTQEDTKNAGGLLKRTLSRVYDQFGRVQQMLNAAGNATQVVYDVNDNLDTVTDPQAHKADQDVDALNRVIKTTQDSGTGGLNVLTQYQYDARDDLVQVTDPKGLNTGYTYDGLNNLVAQVSPDTGTTTYTYDSAGNRATQTDARNVVTNYSYDVLNRLTNVSYPATPALNVVYIYDTLNTTVCGAQGSGESYAKGHLSEFDDSTGKTQFCYDRFGALTRKVQLVTGTPSQTTRFEYLKPGGRLYRVTYPSGAQATYTRNAFDQITKVQLTIAGVTSTLVNSVNYTPFGPFNYITFGNGRSQTRGFDLDYNPDITYGSAADSFGTDYAVDSIGNITAAVEPFKGVTTTRNYGYDGLNRLTQATTPSAPTLDERFTYDGTGDRQSKQIGATGVAVPYVYPIDSHRLISMFGQPRSYDAAGNMTSVGTPGSGFDYVYDDRGRLTTIKFNSFTQRSYQYNGRGERVSKTFAGAPTSNLVFDYDEAGHLLGEYSTAGVPVAEYVWMDDTLVGVIKVHDGSTFQYVETDDLGTPRVVVNPVNNTAIWHWDLTSRAFGEHLPNGDPDGNGKSYTLNLRYPGQYYDGDAGGLNYNYFRDYEPGTGRYAESDPIGLGGGISTYGYVGGGPLSSSDAFGLWPSQDGAYYHQWATEMFVPVGDPNLMAMIVSAQEYADSAPFQTANNAYRHAMSNGDKKQSPCVARALADNFVRYELQQAISARHRGNLSLAMRDFGLALHTLQDSTSPAHEGFQPWGDHESRGQVANHVLSETVPSPFDRNFEQGLLKLRDVTKNAWHWYNSEQLPTSFFGNTCGCN